MGWKKVALFSVKVERFVVGVVDAILAVAGIYKMFRTYAILTVARSIRWDA